MLRFFFDLTGILVLVLVGCDILWLLIPSLFSMQRLTSLLRSCPSHERGKYPKWIFIG